MNITIGIIGGGQIGKMIAQEAKRMSMEVIALDPTPDCPAASVSGRQIVADFKDIDAIRKLAKSSDVVTYEIELGNPDALKQLESEGCKIFPSADTLRIVQDKLLQKEHLKRHGVPVPDFCEVSTTEELAECVSRFGLPTILKLRRDTYDGRGSFTLARMEDLTDLVQKHLLNGNLVEKKYMIEKFVTFTKEISVMIARNQAGQIVSFPVVENIHRDHILFMTIAPARMAPEVADEAKRIAIKAVESLNGVGIFGVEMFITQDGQILINEIAPRPHNSGHYTIEACAHSQFELHLRAILNLPLVEPKLLSPAVLVNILGQEDSDTPYSVEGLDELFSIEGAKLHLYGKKILRRKRKLGHITVLDSTVEGAIEKAERAHKMIRIFPEPGAKA